MKFLLAALALVAVGANAQSLSTISAPCGTSCPSAAPDKMITRSMPPTTGTTPCPSLIVSSTGNANGTNPMATAGPPSPASFKGAANNLAGPVGAVVAAAALAIIL